MKYIKTLGLAAVVAVGLMAFVGASSASATILCKEPGTGTTTGTTCSNPYPRGTIIKTKLVTGTIAKLETSFKTIECKKSEGSGETSAEEAEEITGPEGTFTLEECNCEVKVLKAGTTGIKWISGTHNGTLFSSGSETTTTCSTIFGTVHCLYVTAATDIGTLTGGSPAKEDIHFVILRITTNNLCAEKAVWNAEYEVTSPNPLYIAGHR